MDYKVFKFTRVAYVKRVEVVDRVSELLAHGTSCRTVQPVQSSLVVEARTQKWEDEAAVLAVGTGYNEPVLNMDETLMVVLPAL
jgi:hypothetical protein